MIEEREGYRLAAMGDVMLARGVGQHILEKPEDFLFEEIGSVLKGHDLIVLNLENPVGTNGTPHHVQDPHVTFCGHPDSLQVLRNLGVTVVSLGNNHMLDYGDAALHETVEYLDALGIKHAGAGRNYEEANRPLLMECNGHKIAFLSYVFIYSASTKMATRNKPGISDYRIRKILPEIRDLSLSGYQVNVSIHWGMEYSFFPIPYQMRQARQMIDSGASIILGHGPHYPQGIENYNAGQIVYSLGNFIFDEPHTFANRSFIYSVRIAKNNRLQDMQIHTVHLNNHIPMLVYHKEKDNLEKWINTLSKLYASKNAAFWKKINSLYFSDVVSRVFRMKSLKFIFLPPLSFYSDVGIKNLVKKTKAKNVLSLLKFPLKDMLRVFKKMIWLIFPLGLRKSVALWLNHQQWLSSRNDLTEGIIRDLMESNPEAFHKFMWANHILSYAAWYDSETLFDSKKMNGSEQTYREFFNDLGAVIKDLNLDPSKDIRSTLEVGCSLGYLLRFIERDIFRSSKDLVGIDIDCVAIDRGTRYLRSVNSKVRLICGDMEELGHLVENDRFDFVFSSGVLSYLNETDATKVVSEMLSRTNKILALVGLACTSVYNRELLNSQLSPDHHYQWIHNFEAMIEAADGCVIASRWEGDKQFNNQPIYFVFAVPKAMYPLRKLD